MIRGNSQPAGRTRASLAVSTDTANSLRPAARTRRLPSDSRPHTEETDYCTSKLSAWLTVIRRPPSGSLSVAEEGVNESARLTRTLQTEGTTPVAEPPDTSTDVDCSATRTSSSATQQNRTRARIGRSIRCSTGRSIRVDVMPTAAGSATRRSCSASTALAGDASASEVDYRYLRFSCPARQCSAPRRSIRRRQAGTPIRQGSRKPLGAGLP